MTDAQPKPSGPRYTQQTVLAKTTWLENKLFSLTVTRDPTFTFTPGQFARLGLFVGASPTDTNPSPATASSTESALTASAITTASAVSDMPALDLHNVPNEWRAYSMVSKPDANELEFFSVVVPEGRFSPALASLSVGDPIWIDKTVFGFLTLERFVEGEDLWLIATGTGLSAYLSMLRDPATWTRFKRIILLHGVRRANELAYREEMLELAKQADHQRAPNRAQFIYLPITSQEPLAPELSPNIAPNRLLPARLTTLLGSGELEHRVGTPLDTVRSRVMLCGNPAMVTDMRALLSERGFVPGRRGVAGNLAVENYW